MSDTFILGACLIGFVLAVAWAWAAHVEKKGLYPDEIDMRLSKLWNERNRQNQCIYCGNPLDRPADGDWLLSESVCPACPPFVSEPMT